MSDDPDQPAEEAWEDDAVRALAELSPSTLPSLEILLIDGFAELVYAGLDGVETYTQDHAALGVNTMLNALLNAADVQPDREPPETTDIMVSRLLVSAGANALAEDEVGLDRLIGRLIPAFQGELTANAGRTGAQIGRMFLFSMLALASGMDGEPPAPAAKGVDDVFGAWDQLIADGWRLPWRA